jgi:excisionase family DNA binding protein
MAGARLSTGDAARLCSVNADTVLKWIKKGQLAATRTAGGHYRIDEADLAAHLPAPPSATPKPLRCWEYLSRAGAVRDGCRTCVVYQMQAAWCFRLSASVLCEAGRERSACAGSCDDCSYYRRASGQTTQVLVVTADDALVQTLGPGNSALSMRFARNTYEASAVLAAFRAAFVVIDQAVLANGQSDLIECLLSDDRVPGVRIILGTASGVRARVAWENSCAGILEKPFGADRIAEVVDRFPVEPAPRAGTR